MIVKSEDGDEVSKLHQPEPRRLCLPLLTDDLHAATVTPNSTVESVMNKPHYSMII
jgi:hypothetical protein